MLNLRQVRVWIAVIHERVQKLGRLPDALLASVEAKVFLLFRHNIVVGLVLVIQPVELCYTGSCLLVILAKLVLALAFVVATGKKVVPLIHVLQGRVCCNQWGGHRGSSGASGKYVTANYKDLREC